MRKPRQRHVTPLLALGGALLAGCGAPDPAREAAAAYVGVLHPLVDENGRIYDRLLTEASAVYNEEVGHTEARIAWRQDLVPLAEHLRDQAVAVKPPAEWKPEHDELVEIWSVRADAWREVVEAIDQGDAAAWRHAREQADDAKLREEAWFRSVNDELAPHGLTLDQFPDARHVHDAP